MKKLLITAVALALSFASEAAMTDWKLTSVNKDYNGWYTYIIAGDSVQNSWTSFEQLSGAAANDGSKISGATTKAASGKAADDSFTTTDGAKYYFVLVDGNSAATAKNYMVGSTVVTVGGNMVYDPAAQQSSPGATSTKYADVSWGAAKEFGGSDVPEPTSGLLLLLGMAGLALRRKQA